MTVSQAKSHLKKIIKNRKKIMNGFLDKNQPWHGNKISSELAEGLAEFLREEISNLEMLLKLLDKNSSKCKHPKKDHDRCNGVLYCMNCNTDL